MGLMDTTHHTGGTMSTTAHEITDRENAIIDEYRVKLETGQAFALAASAARSRRGYEPPISRRDFRHVMATLAKMAGESDELAQLATAIMHKVNLYGTPSQVQARLYDAALEALNKGYTDVINLSSPEPGRYSDNKRDFSIHTRVTLMAFLSIAKQPLERSAPGLGWCLAELCRRQHQHRLVEEAKKSPRY